MNDREVTQKMKVQVMLISINAVKDEAQTRVHALPHAFKHKTNQKIVIIKKDQRT